MNDQPTDRLSGQQLDEYRLEALLGQGGMARVYRGFDTRLERLVAIKVIDAPFRADPDYIRRFEREGRAIAQLKHPNIVTVYRYGEVNGLLFMAMEYIQGSDLKTWLASHHQTGQSLPIHEVMRIIRQVCLALDYIHDQGVIHRDIKPSNIMLDQHGDAFLTDFGLALLQDHGTQGQAFGTPHYMAPEQVVSSAHAVPQSDLYAVGVILYEIFTGRLPFETTHPHDVALMQFAQPPLPPRTINPALSPALEGVILQAMAKEPAERYATGAALIDALMAALRDSSKINPYQEETMADGDHLRKLITRYQRRLQKLEERKAVYGINVDPEVEIEIEDLKQILGELSEELEYGLTGQSIGKYPLHDLIGQGGVAKVYRSWHPGLLCNVAIKIIDDRFFKQEETGEEFLERFQNEAATLASLSHPNIINVYDFAREDHKCYMVMDLIEGPTLATRLKEYRDKGHIFPLTQTVQIIQAIASALDYIHSRKIIHHDLKPDNIIFASPEADAPVILADFGIARLVGSSGMTQVVLGTPAYMAPEQVMQQREDKRSDIYALGLILYELVTGQPPFSADTPFGYLMKQVNEAVPPPTQLNPQLPGVLEPIILKALAKKPEDRYESAGQLALIIQEAIQPARPSIPAETTQPVAPAPGSSPASPLPPRHYGHFTGRNQELDSLLAVLQEPERYPLIALYGLGGIGKTALARKAAMVSLEAGRFHQLIWSSAKTEQFEGLGVKPIPSAHKLTFESLLDEIASQCHLSSALAGSSAEKLETVQALLASQPILIVLDNLETVKGYEKLVRQVAGLLRGHSKCLITSRHEVLQTEVHSINLSGIDRSEAIDFLREEGRSRGAISLLQAPEDTLYEIHRVTGGAPLAMKLVAGQLRHRPVEVVLHTLQAVSVQGKEYKFYRFVFKYSWEILPLEAKKLLVSMSAFEPTIGGSPAMAIRVSQVDEGTFYEAMDELITTSLVDFVGNLGQQRYILHPLTYYFVLSDIVKQGSWPDHE